MTMSATVIPLTHALRTVLTQMEVLCAVAQVATDLAVTASLVKVIGILFYNMFLHEQGKYTCRCTIDTCFDIGAKTLAS